MGRQKYKKEKKESFFQKIVNLFLTVLLACAISSQVCTAANNNLRFAQVSDVHFSSYEDNTSYKMLKKSPELLNDVILQLNFSGPYDFVVFTGDLINKPKKTELNKFAKYASKLNYEWYAVDGNHDIDYEHVLNKKEFTNILGQYNKNMSGKNIYYAFTPKRGFRVICLDSIIDYKITSNGEISKEQLLWLEKELNKHSSDVVIICTHVPIDEPYSSSNHKMLNESDVKRLLNKYKNPIIILQGHYHSVKTKQNDNIIYISSPSLVTYPNAYRVININSNKNRTLIDIFLKETNLKDVQSRSKLRVFGGEKLYGSETDRNTTFEIKKI